MGVRGKIAILALLALGVWAYYGGSFVEGVSYGVASIGDALGFEDLKLEDKIDSKEIVDKGRMLAEINFDAQVFSSGLMDDLIDITFDYYLADYVGKSNLFLKDDIVNDYGPGSRVERFSIIDMYSRLAKEGKSPIVVKMLDGSGFGLVYVRDGVVEGNVKPFSVFGNDSFLGVSVGGYGTGEEVSGGDSLDGGLAGEEGGEIDDYVDAILEEGEEDIIIVPEDEFIFGDDGL